MADKAIGNKMKKIRTALGVSQMKLAEGIGVSFQQIQKYESGKNNVSIEKLKKISLFLNVPVSYFIEEIPPYRSPETAASVGKAGIDFEKLTDEEVQMLLWFRNIKNPELKKGIAMVLKGVSQHGGRSKK